MSIVKAEWVLIPSNDKSTKISLCPDNTLVINEPISSGLIGIPHEVYVSVEQPIMVGDWGIGYQVGIRGVGAGYYLFYNDGSRIGRLNAVCRGARKVVASSDGNLSCGKFNLDFINSLVLFYNSSFHYRNQKNSGEVLIEFDNLQSYYKGSKIGVLFNEITNDKPTFTAYDSNRVLIVKNAPTSELYCLPKVNSDGEVNIKFPPSNFNIDDLKDAYVSGFKNGSRSGNRVAHGGELNVTSFDEWFFNKI